MSGAVPHVLIDGVMTRRRGERVGRARGGQHPLQNGLRVEPIDAPDGEEPLPVIAITSMPPGLATI
jgi:hypothetical protein